MRTVRGSRAITAILLSSLWMGAGALAKDREEYPISPSDVEKAVRESFMRQQMPDAASQNRVLHCAGQALGPGSFEVVAAFKSVPLPGRVIWQLGHTRGWKPGDSVAVYGSSDGDTVFLGWDRTGDTERWRKEKPYHYLLTNPRADSDCTSLGTDPEHFVTVFDAFNTRSEPERLLAAAFVVVMCTEADSLALGAVICGEADLIQAVDDFEQLRRARFKPGYEEFRKQLGMDGLVWYPKRSAYPNPDRPSNEIAYTGPTMTESDGNITVRFQLLTLPKVRRYHELSDYAIVFESGSVKSARKDILASWWGFGDMLRWRDDLKSQR